MSDTFFYTMMAILISALFAVMYAIVRIITDEIRNSSRCVGLTMIAMVAVIVGAALPWYLL